VQFIRFDGDQITDKITDEARISGRLDEVIERTEDKFDAHNLVKVDFTSGSRETRTELYPRLAFQQLFRNAVMHRTYEHTNAPVKVSWFSDRIEIQSPGGPFGVVTPENFGQPGITDYRNPNIAEALRNLGYVQRFGAGIAIARKALERNGNPELTFTVNAAYTLVTVRP
jgi:ATP-dependent DNA helicase RecG